MKLDPIQVNMCEALKLLKVEGVLHRHTLDSDAAQKAKQKARAALDAYEKAYGKKCATCGVPHSGGCSRIQGEGCNCDEQQCGPDGRGCGCKCHWRRQARERKSETGGR